MEKTITIKYLRIAPKKLVVLASGLKRQNALEVINRTHLSVKKGARIISQAVKSGVSLFDKADQDNVRLKNLLVGKGPMFKRARPGGRGAQHMYLKRTSHLQVVLELPKIEKNNGK
jgi:large subunit ribosomal protein L22